MFCAKCGAVLPDNAEKCDQCGALVRIRPGQPGNKNKGRKTRVSRQDEPALTSEKNAQKPVQEESLMDPVFFEEAGKDVDVDAIIKIAHGEVPDKTEKAADDKKEAGKKTFSSGRSGSRRFEPEEPEEEEPELNMETYLESLPFIEKIRRKIQANHHKREEAADERRMKKHLERASKHFSEVESEDLKAEERRLQEEAARRREEKLRAERAEAERAAQAALLREKEAQAVSAVKADGEDSDAEKRREDKLRAEKAEAERAEAARLQEEAIRRQEEEKRAERIAAAARQKEKARAGAVRRQGDQQKAQAAASQEKEGPEVIRLHGRDRYEQANVREEEEVVEAALLQEAERAAEAARLQAEEDARIRAAKQEQSVLEQEEKDHIQKILNTRSEEYDSFKPISEHNQKELSEADRQIEKLRRQRKYRNNQPDRFDEFLGKYGLTKETAVRIATLFLIVLLSVIYVMGRGSSNTAPEPSGTGEEMTGIEAVQEQADDGTETEPSGDFEDTQVPTGGGDFENN